MRKAPAFQFYAADFLVGTLSMTPEQVGGYIRLLCYQWEHGPIPDKPELLCRITGCSADAVASIRHKFGIAANGALANERLEAVREQQEQYRKKQAERAVSGWNKRKADGSAMPALVPDGCSSTPTSSSKGILPAPAKPARKRDELFDCLAKAEGSNPEQLTKSAARTIGVALAEIRKASPDVSAEEIARRAQQYRRVMPQGSTLTASALAKHWARCGEVVRLAPATPARPTEPPGWREKLNQLRPDNTFEGSWATLPAEMKRLVQDAITNPANQ